MSVVEHGFKAEVQQLLDLMIHSVYSEREVFLRELISNSADALDKARFIALTETDLVESDSDQPGIRISVDEEAKTITIEDDGVGMTSSEVESYLGTIAHSGTKAFANELKKRSESESTDKTDLIGQFGIGFYSVFMVASEVVVETRSMRAGNDAVVWRSEGAGTYSIAPGERAHRGTRITLHLRHDADEFANETRINAIIRKYSNYVPWPITVGEKQANSSKALWAENPANVTDEERATFYKSLTMDWQDPAVTLHVSVDSPIQYSAMLFVPADRPYDLFVPQGKSGLRLYARRVLISEQATELLPEWLRFVRGVVDSQDIPLNVSREMIQKTAIVRKIKDALTNRILKELRDYAEPKGEASEKEAKIEKYQVIWRNFGVLLKEGYYHSRDKLRERILPLLRFNALSHASSDEMMSLAAYKAALPEDQKTIWYITAADRDAALGSPSLEAFREHNIDVLLLTDSVDEWLVTMLTEFDGLPLKSVTRGELDFGESKDEQSEAKTDLTELIPWLTDLYGSQIASVRPSNRLTASAAVLVDSEQGMSANMERILTEANQQVPTTERVLELNPSHPLVQNLASLTTSGQADVAKPLANLLLDEAMLVDGSLKDPAGMAGRLQQLLVRVSSQAVEGRP